MRPMRARAHDGDMAMSPRVKPYVRRFGGRARAFAERVPPFVVVHHVGRKSGKPYLTPVVAFAGQDEQATRVVASPLVWGSDADWCRNIRAAGSYTLTRRRREYVVDELRLVGSRDAARLVGAGARLANVTFRPKEWIVGRLQAAPGRVTV